MASLATEFTQEDPSPCSPEKLQRTWARDAVKAALIAKSAGLCRIGGDVASPQILGLRLGNGFGKTHALLDAPEHLGCHEKVYITYNGGQDLTRDVQAPAKALLLRILMRLVGVSNVDCPKVFERYHGLLQLDDEALMNFVCGLVEERLVHRPSADKKMFIGIDDVGVLVNAGNNSNQLQNFTSLVGKLVVALQTKGIIATVLVSALMDGTFAAISKRRIERMELPEPGMDAHHFIREQLLPDATVEQIALIQAFGGFHFRSIAVLCLLLKDPVGGSVVESNTEAR